MMDPHAVQWLLAHAPQIVFVAAIVFSVSALELYRSWLGRQDGGGARDVPHAIALALGTVFALMIAAAVGDYLFLTGAKSFLNLSLLLTGVAGAGVLGDLLWRFHTGRPLDGGDGGMDPHDSDYRRAVARDL